MILVSHRWKLHLYIINNFKCIERTLVNCIYINWGKVIQVCVVKPIEHVGFMSPLYAFLGG